MKKILIWLFILISYNLFSGEIEDLKFSIGLYKDENYKFAKTQLESFFSTYPTSKYFSDAKFIYAQTLGKLNKFEEAEEEYLRLYKTCIEKPYYAEIILNLANAKMMQNDKQKLNEAENLLINFSEKYYKNNRYNDAIYYLTKIYIKKNDIEKASQYLKILPIDYKFDDVLYLKIKVSCLQKDFKNSEQFLSKFTKRNEQYAKSLVWLLNSLEENNHFEEIIRISKKYSLPKNSPFKKDYFLILGIAYYQTQNYDKAMKHLSEIKNDIFAKYYLGLIYKETNKFESAYRLFSEIAKNNNNDIASNASFYLSEINAKLGKGNIINDLEHFIEKNPNHKFTGAAYFQIGWQYFNKEDYNKSLNNFQKAQNYELDNDSKEKNYFLIAESCFLLKDYEKALNYYQDYLKAYKGGKYADETLFKIGYIFFNKKDYPKAFNYFDKILTDFPNSNRVALTHFYLGEIYYFKNQFSIAKEHYQSAYHVPEYKNLVRQRLAEISYSIKDFVQAKILLDSIPDTTELNFDKYLLLGNIFFSQKKYKSALQKFQKASEFVKDDFTRETINTKLADTYYNLKEYSKAAEIYASLSKTKNSKSKNYLLMQGNSLFNNGSYLEAITKYKEYLKLYPQSNEKYNIMLSIADSYYNAGNYVNSTIEYKKLIDNDVPKVILKNAIDGFDWSLQKQKNINIIQEYESLINTKTNYIKSALLLKLIEYNFSVSNWENVIEGSNKISNSYPEIKNASLLFKAKALSKINKYNEADELFASIKNPTASQYANWAELKLTQSDTLSAINKYINAFNIENDNDYLLNILKLKAETSADDFLNYYKEVKDISDKAVVEEADIYYLTWKLNKNEFDIDNKIEELLQSNYQFIRANAQYLKGKLFYKKGKYEASVFELLRIRYVYQKLNDVKTKAEYLACFGYLKMNDIEKAKKLFTNIKEELSPAEIQKFQKELNKIGGDK